MTTHSTGSTWSLPVVDDLADRIRRFQEETRADAAARRRNTKASRAARVSQDIKFWGRFVAQVTQAVIWLRQYVWLPVWHVLKRVALAIARLYRRLWAWVVYRRDSDGELVFSRPRAGAMLLATGVFVWYLLIPLIRCGYDAALYAMTAQVDEQVYLLGSQEIDSTTGEHIVEGCSALPCSDRDAVYFRTEDSLFNNLWSLAHGRGMFYPEYVGAAVPYSTSRCAITSYGVRKRFPFRIVNMYSDMLAVTCHPE
jgi:hypothetical protein